MKTVYIVVENKRATEAFECKDDAINRAIYLNDMCKTEDYSIKEIKFTSINRRRVDEIPEKLLATEKMFNKFLELIDSGDIDVIFYGKVDSINTGLQVSDVGDFIDNLKEMIDEKEQAKEQAKESVEEAV
jgi:hypothetical protein